ncbi:MAG: hypothetical protein U0841_04945 [Chloroflexia bacterium]
MSGVAVSASAADGPPGVPAVVACGVLTGGAAGVAVVVMAVEGFADVSGDAAITALPAPVFACAGPPLWVEDCSPQATSKVIVSNNVSNPRPWRVVASLLA